MLVHHTSGSKLHGAPQRHTSHPLVPGKPRSPCALESLTALLVRRGARFRRVTAVEGRGGGCDGLSAEHSTYPGWPLSSQSRVCAQPYKADTEEQQRRGFGDEFRSPDVSGAVAEDHLICDDGLGEPLLGKEPDRVFVGDELPEPLGGPQAHVVQGGWCEGRILAVADTFDAMTSDRPYRKRRSIEDTIEELKTHSGTQFDPEIVQLFLDLFSEHNLTWLLDAFEQHV